MQFRELNVNMRFRFHSFSNEIWRKVSETECICLTYEDSEIDEPYDVKQRVFPIVEQVDKFQPMALIATLRKAMQDVRVNEKLSQEKAEGVTLGLAWAIAEIQQLAMHRYEESECPGIDKVQAEYLMEHNG